MEPGKLADVVVLTGDLLNMPEDDIPELKSFMTLVGGRSMPLSPNP